MKQFWLLFSCMCGLISGASGQSGIGLRGGPLLSQVNYSYVRPPDNTPLRPAQALVQGMEVGLVGRYMNSKHLGIQAEVNFSRQGWHIYLETEGERLKELEMVQVPVLSYLQLGRGRLKFTVQAGAFVGYVLGQKDVIIPVQEDVPGQVRYSHQKEQPWQYGIVVGGGPSFTFPFGVLQLEGRFSQAMSDLIRTDYKINDDYVDFDVFSLQTITFSLQWVYMFESRR